MLRAGPGPGRARELRVGDHRSLRPKRPRQGHPNIVRFLGLWADPTALESKVGCPSSCQRKRLFSGVCLKIQPGCESSR